MNAAQRDKSVSDVAETIEFLPVMQAEAARAAQIALGLIPRYIEAAQHTKMQ